MRSRNLHAVLRGGNCVPIAYVSPLSELLAPRIITIDAFWGRLFLPSIWLRLRLGL